MEKIDSELLTILRSLVMTGSQTKTALSLSKSQSTISRTLSRARTLFHDPLFVHNGSMLVPTNRMLEIYGHLPKLLGEMEALFAKEIFHPESLNLHLRVAAIDYAAQYIILPAFHAMKRIAPRISIELQQLNADTFRRLSLGLVDMAMRLECTAPNELHSLELYEAKLLALVRKGHPAFDLLRHKGSLHFDDLLQWEFVQVNRTFTGLEWTTSLHPGALNHPAVMVPYSSLLAPTILETDWIALASARYALDAVKRLPVAILPIRLDCVKRMRTLYWHDRTHLDPAMQWVRSMIAAYGKPSSAEIAEYEIAIQDTGNGS